MELAQSARQEDAPAPGIAPYKGLLFFDQADADLFFGREALTAHLAERVTDLAMDASSRFLAVVGASGSGKSSLVRAGLAVALQRLGWEIHIFTPTADPLKMLAANYNPSRAKKRPEPPGFGGSIRRNLHPLPGRKRALGIYRKIDFHRPR